MSTIADGTFKKFTKLSRWYVKQLEVTLFRVRSFGTIPE